jgi:hypothetical protein
LDIGPHLEEENRVDDGHSSGGKYANILRSKQTNYSIAIKRKSNNIKKEDRKVVECDVPQAVTFCKYAATPIFFNTNSVVVVGKLSL